MKGRGANIDPRNRFESVHSEADWEQLEGDDEFLASRLAARTVYLPDDSQSIISENDSPDVFFRYSINPYRGCSHGCSYCYARPTHEYLGMNAGIDFEAKILVKQRAPDLLRDWLARPKYQPELIVMSGVTDCYQPAERQYQLTRRCLEVALEARQPIGIITKNALVARDLDLLQEMARLNIIRVSLSVTSLDDALIGAMEPRTSRPQARLRTIGQLREAGVPVGVMVAPVIPGLNDSEIPTVLKAAADAGAQVANYIVLRLPLNVRPVFVEWLERNQPLDKDRILSRIRSTRDGELTDSAYGRRMRGEGEMAAQIGRTFQVFAKKYGLDGKLPPLEFSHFRPPRTSSGQMNLF
jgi:DNA repair photolyase